MGLLRRFVDDLQSQVILDTRAKLEFLDKHVEAKFKRMEGRLMARISDVARDFDAALDALGAAVEREIKQLADAIAAAGNAGDLEAVRAELEAVKAESEGAADRVAAGVEKMKGFADALRADDPAEAPTTETPAEPPPAEVPAPPAEEPKAE